MKIPTNQQELDVAVAEFRADKLENFADVLDDKVAEIADYFNQHGIKNVVVGVSGGIDSAVVVGLLARVKQHIPLNIFAYTITFSLYDGIFEPKYVHDLHAAFEDRVLMWSNLDASHAFQALMENMGITDPHVMAQSSYALRYQMLFTFAQTMGAVTVGTTNKDEFKYAGWFGKNSDMVVDLQVITDWHKCQVVEAAKLLGVPESIIQRKAVGDLLDRSTDEENFGCSYDELAYFQTRRLRLEQKNPFLKEKYAKLRALHQKNSHKYQGQTFNPIFL